jgi:hypothetical protein
LRESFCEDQPAKAELDGAKDAVIDLARASACKRDPSRDENRYNMLLTLLAQESQGQEAAQRLAACRRLTGRPGVRNL